MSVTTPNIGLVKSDVLGSEDVWGDELNRNADTLDSVIGTAQTDINARVAKAGDTMTGPLVLNAAPSAALGAATKGYVDAGDATLQTNINARVAKAGDTMTGALTLAADPTQPLQAATKQYADARQSAAQAYSDANFLRLTGGTLTGLLTLSGAPTVNLHAATKLYVDSQVSSVAGIAEAPQDGLVYGRSNANWSAVVANNNIGRNLLHNPLFNVAQRGAGPWTADGYTLDRWSISANNGDTQNVVQGALSDTARGQIGDETASNYLGNAFVGTAAAAARTIVFQPIENVRRLANKTVTISFWAQASAALKLGCSLDQNFGVGGSPSPIVTGIGQSVVLSTTWTRYSVTLTVPSIAGKTVGTTPNSSSTLFFMWCSSGSTNAARSGNVGVQSGSINLWGVQLEIGSVATPLEKPDPRYDLANCQRFYKIFPQAMTAGYATAGATFYSDFPFPQMRAVPTVNFGSISYGNASNMAVNGVVNNHVRLQAQAVASSAAYAIADIMLTADL